MGVDEIVRCLGLAVSCPDDYKDHQSVRSRTRRTYLGHGEIRMAL